MKIIKLFYQRQQVNILCLMFCMPGLLISKNVFAIASNDDIIRPFVSAGMTYDSNFLRLSDDVPLGPLTGIYHKSELITQLLAGFNLDYKISRQHLLVNAALNQNFFQNNSEYDYLGWDIATKWGWQIGNHLSGELAYNTKSSLGSFSQLNQKIANNSTTERYYWNGAYFFHPQWKVHTELNRSTWKFDDPVRNVSNTTLDSVEIGLNYISPTRSTIGVSASFADGSFPNRLLTTRNDTGYTRNKFLVKWDWLHSVKTRVNGHFGYFNQEYDHLKVNDFSDFVAQTKVEWAFSELTNFTLKGWRSLDQMETLYSNFVLTQGIDISTNWRPKPKVNISGTVTFEKQNYVGSPEIINAVTARKDTIHRQSLQMQYFPLNNTVINLTLQNEDRMSNIQQRSYNDKSVGINLQYYF